MHLLFYIISETRNVWFYRAVFFYFLLCPCTRFRRMLRSSRSWEIIHRMLCLVSTLRWLYLNISSVFQIIKKNRDHIAKISFTHPHLYLSRFFLLTATDVYKKYHKSKCLTNTIYKDCIITKLRFK